ncbi:MAG: hypothetical protein GX300_00160 [Tissierellia bacterium]|nr:hypothetical protein [Tissierellia bacterium]
MIIRIKQIIIVIFIISMIIGVLSLFKENIKEVRDIILEGSKKANKIGNETVENVKNALNIDI